MGFEVDFLVERVGRTMVGFIGKRKKQKVIHGPHATPSHHAPPPCRSVPMPGRALPDAEDQRVNGRPPWAKRKQSAMIGSWQQIPKWQLHGVDMIHQKIVQCAGIPKLKLSF